MARVLTYDGDVKSKDISNWTADEWVSVFGSYSGHDGHHPARMFSAVGWLYACVNLRARRMAAMPWALYRGETPVAGNDQDNEQFPYLADFPDMVYLTEASLALVGRAFWFKVRNRRNVPLELRWLAADTMTPVWDSQAGITAYERQVGNRRTVLAAEDVLYFRLPNPMHETEPGVSPVMAALSDAAVLHHMDDFVASFFKRGAIKATLLTVEGNPPRQEMEKLENWWRRFFSGVRDAWQTAAVRAGVSPVVVGEGLESLTNASLTMERRESIATALGVPHSLVASNAANYATAQQDEINLITGTLMPQARLIERVLNRDMFAPIGLRFAFQPDKLSAMQEDEEQRAGSFAQYVGAGIRPSIAAQLVGLSLPDGITFEDLDPEPAPVSVPMAPMVAPVEPNPADTMRAAEVRRFKRWAKGKKAPDATKFESEILTLEDRIALLGEGADTEHLPFPITGGRTTRDAKALVLQANPDDDEEELAARLEAERKAQEAIQRALRDAERAVAEAAEAAGDNLTLSELEAVVAQQFAPGGKAADALARALQDGADLGVSMAVAQFDTIGLGFDWTLPNLDARDWAQRYSYELIRGIEQTTVNGVRQAVSRWIENGEPLIQLKRDLAPLFGAQRAEMIAVTEVTRAYAEGNRAAYRASGVVAELEWRTAQDEIAAKCPICGPLHGTRTSVDSPSFGPKGLTAPPAHPRCRCIVAPVVREPGDAN